MKFILTSNWDKGIADLTGRLERDLASGNRVLWLVSGGSNVPASVQVTQNLANKSTRGLTIMLVDERHGEPGHDASNWKQLMDAGFQANDATMLEILKPGLGLDQTVNRYNLLVEEAFEGHDLILAQLGIGGDGHIAGILPYSPATRSDKFVFGYESPPLNRMTLTFSALREIQAAYVFAFGHAKLPALSSLQNEALALSKQPSQILKQLPEAYVYNDQIGDNA